MRCCLRWCGDDMSIIVKTKYIDEKHRRQIYSYLNKMFTVNGWDLDLRRSVEDYVDNRTCFVVYDPPEGFEIIFRLKWGG